MESRGFIHNLLKPGNWWISLAVIFIISAMGVIQIGMHTYTEAPPIPDFKAQDASVIYSHDEILLGQQVFQRYGLMEYGSMFGDGANRGPDYTAEALHQTSVFMADYYLKSIATSAEDQTLQRYGIAELVKREIKSNTYHAASNSVKLTDAQAYAAKELEHYYQGVFRGEAGKAAGQPGRYIQSDAEVRSLTAFFFWGSWVCGAERPGKDYSFTHNWPYDAAAGNVPSSPVMMWSIIGALGLILVLGLVLYYHGKLEKLDDDSFTKNASPLFTKTAVSSFSPNRLQRATYKFFFAAIALFAVQVLAGILTVHDFVHFVNFWGFNVSEHLPLVITRSWHVQLSLLWISACWIGSSLFVMPMLSPRQPQNQLTWVNVLFAMIVVLVAGGCVSIFLGPKGLAGEKWNWFGHQGWEYLEPGRVWQILLYSIFVVWLIILYRGLKPVVRLKQPWALPNWLVYTVACILILLSSGFLFNPTTNFVISDFWRWMVIHMWAEAFFEVFTTVLIGYFMVLMGLVSVKAATRVIYLACLLFLGSGLLGISHNFYWNAKPVFTMALGSVFSTLQVVPLILLTLEAWRFRKLPGYLSNDAPETSAQSFGFSQVFLFLLGVNFWNFFGAGVLGFIINLPIANYYEHGTYLTVNHGHAALMGVYGNLALAAVLFCCQLLFRADRWNPKLITTAFWSINIGLLLMVLLDLFPAGLLQLSTVIKKGLWYARSSEFIDSTAFQSLTWLRIIGGATFVLGGVIPITWFILSRRKALKEPSENKNGKKTETVSPSDRRMVAEEIEA
ncbi:MAG: cbb3-type cytochrome c oxidase subunit I [Bacteroidetes bacterium]|nr:cbb3-type cytochrome c oxidase subunit I [Bacteroidota bacterium]MBS1539618.1 cbb3-type cytochrome c oxidase subunit I [Bacteroidota bacterium]